MPDKLPADQLWQEWVKKADEDELNIKSILKHRDGTSNWVGFLAQQMAEKYMKGLLVFHEQKYPKIHFLNRIATLLEPFSPQIFDFAEDYNKLSQLYIIDRYPGYAGIVMGRGRRRLCGGAKNQGVRPVRDCQKTGRGLIAGLK